MNLVADELDGGWAVAGPREKLRKRDADLAHVAISEDALGAEEDVEEVAGEVAIGRDGKVESRVPGRVAAALAVRRRALPRQMVIGEEDHGVDGHFEKEVDVLETLGRDQGDLQRPVRHGRDLQPTI